MSTNTKPVACGENPPEAGSSQSPAERALAASELRYRRLFETAKDGILILDADTGIVVDVNPFLLDLLDYPYEEFIGKAIWELGFFKDIVANQDHFAELQRKEYIRYEDKPMETADGRRIEVEFISNVYLVDHKKVIQCNIRDNTEHKRTKDQIERLSRFPSENPSPVLRVSTRGMLHYANTAADTLLPALGVETIGDSVNAEWQAHIDKAVAEARPIDVEFSAAGCTFAATLAPFVSQRYVNLYLRDITEKKQVMAALRKSEETQRVLLNAATESALLLDLEGLILDANNTAARNLNVDGIYIRGLCIYDLLPQDLVASTRKHVEMAIQFGMVQYEETSAGEVHNVSIFPIFDRQNVVERVAFFARDITREKAVDKMKSEFVSIASHELRTPISNITEAVSQVIDRLYGEINEEQQSILMIALRNCERMGRLIRNFLDLSRIEFGNVKLHRTFVDLGAMIRKVCDSFMTEARVKGLDLRCKVDSGIPMVFGDGDRLEQVLINLIGNALKFTPSGGKITVEARLEREGILCTVADTGIGIAPKELVSVFEKFVTGSSSAHGGNSGTGLGLAIAQQMVRLHGGDLWVESESGRGSRFVFRLPDYQSEDALLENLDKRIAMTHSKPWRIQILGIRPRWLNEQQPPQIDIAPLFFLKLRDVLAEKLDAGINVWYLGNSGELVIVLDDSEDHTSKIRQAILHRHEECRFSINGSPMEFGLNLATASYPADAADAHQLRCVLSDRLCKAPPVVNAPRTVLIVDDDDSIVTVVERFLYQKPLQTLRALTGNEALDLAIQQAPDAILLDMGLPGISGYEVVARLKSNTSTRHIPLLIVTGQDVDRTKLDMFQHHIPVLRKPFTRDDLITHVYRLLNIELISVEPA